MLMDWESYSLPPGMPDMSPRHAPEIRFRPTTINVRRDPITRRVMILSLDGPRVINGSVVFTGTIDSWEWDADRDPGMGWICELLKVVVGP